MNLSKSKYTLGVRCYKLLWLSMFKKEEASEVESDSVLESGNLVGELARHLFGDTYTLIDFDKGFDNMIKDTIIALEDSPNIICEASFAYDNNFCSIDILKNDSDGVEVYEVKSSTDIKDIYIDDISYQVWVLKKNGLKVKNAYIVYVNSDYIKDGELDIHKYFKIKNVTNILNLDVVLENITKFKDILRNKTEINTDLSLSCKNPYPCPFFSYCTRSLPRPNVFDVGCSTFFSKKLDMYYQGKVTYEELLKTNAFSDKAREQMMFELYDLEPKIDKPSIKSLLDSFTYPLYFLDFESYQEAIPKIDGTRPYQQICFQYSLHYYLEEGGKLYHKEYLSCDYDGNPMYGLSKQLCDDIPLNSCILVYNDSFEKTRLKEMALLFPDYSSHLLNIRDGIKDLLPPFKNHQYYVKEMYGSASIKKVLPALFPNDKTLDYHNLEDVHKGDEASNAYLSLSKLSKDKEEKLRTNMLKYCWLDTYAMVKIYNKLKEDIK